MKLISLFSGVGGLDIGFEKQGFETVWANEFDKDIWQTFNSNFPNTYLDKRSIVNIPSDEIPEADGLIGGPPCQSWSEAGKSRGLEDERGQLFFEFIRILRDKKPKFFLAENVSGMLAPRHKDALVNIKKHFIDSGYDLYFELLNAKNHNVPQDRKRVFFIGFRKDLNVKNFKFPEKQHNLINLQDTIYDLIDTPLPSKDKGLSNKDDCVIANHEYLLGGFSSMYMSRNRVRGWNEQSFTIQAGGRHAPLHPQAPKMEQLGKDSWIFKKGKEDLYRRLSIRECARIQTFDDDYILEYNKLLAGYKMIGNAVPPNLASEIAKTIKETLF